MSNVIPIRGQRRLDSNGACEFHLDRKGRRVMNVTNGSRLCRRRLCRPNNSKTATSESATKDRGFDSQAERRRYTPDRHRCPFILLTRSNESVFWDRRA